MENKKESSQKEKDRVKQIYLLSYAKRKGFSACFCKVACI